MVPTASLHAKTPVDAILVYYAGKGISQSSTVRKAFEDAICYWSTYYVLAVHNRLAVPSPLYDSHISRNGTDCLSDVSHSTAAEIRFFPIKRVLYSSILQFDGLCPSPTVPPSNPLFYG